MRLYNTWSRCLENFQPFHPPLVGLYACGPTVYDYAHLGHLRKYVMDDVLIRTLRHAGYQVKFVQNITDVGHLTSDADTGQDKLEKGAQKYGKSVWDIARDFEAYFWKSMDLMGNIRPDISCRATEHISQQLQVVLELEKKGFTYVIADDGVYFDTSRLKNYGQLARLDSTALREGARVDMVPGKRQPTDFALWKFERPGENRAMVWPSPWAKRSFPGWHIECSAMSIYYLGDQFDIHTGGIDHIPVHHTNEIAQAQAATGREPFVKYWVHHHFLMVDGQKMSKSLGNFYTIDDVIGKNYQPAALRLLFLTGHYRSEMNFTWQSLAGSQKAWERLANQVATLAIQVDQILLTGLKSDEVKETALSPTGQEWRRKFFAMMENDLQTPEALTLVWEVVKLETLTSTEKYHLLLEFDEVLGLGLAKISGPTKPEINLSQLPARVVNLVTQRQQARQNQNWIQADRLRQQIDQAGYQVIDTAEGQKLLDQN